MKIFGKYGKMNNSAELPYEITPLFPLPLYKTNIGREFTEQEQDEFDTIIEKNVDQKSPEYATRQSIDKYVLERKPLLTIKSFLEHHLKQFTNNILGITDPNISCSITQSWLNVTIPQQYFFPHHHSNSIISGVFYPKCLKYPDDRLDEIIFNKNENTSMFQFFEIPGQKPTPFSAPNFICPLVTGDLVLFPSNIKHSVPTNNTNQNRISLAFNTFFFGALGTYEDTSELIFKQGSHEYK